MSLEKFDRLLTSLRGSSRIIIQAHDFPDHDAIGSAFALAYLLKKRGLLPLFLIKALLIEFL